MQQLKFSFILPCYNVEEYIGNCLDSLLNQDIPHSEYEIICVNDCSHDNLSDVVRGYQQRYSNVILIEHTENKTAGGARNTGIVHARGEYIWFVDPDDEIIGNRLTTIYQIMSDSELDTLLFNYYTADENSDSLRVVKEFTESLTQSGVDYVRNRTDKSLSRLCMIWNACYRTNFIRENNITFPHMRKSQDVIFAWRSILQAKRIKTISMANYVYRYNSNSVTHMQKDALILYSDMFLLGREIDNLISDSSNILPNDIRKQMSDVCKWCIDSNVGNIKRLPNKELHKFYNFIKQDSKMIKQLYKYLSRKNKILLSCGTFNYPLWKYMVQLY